MIVMEGEVLLCCCVVVVVDDDDEIIGVQFSMLLLIFRTRRRCDYPGPSRSSSLFPLFH